jgi:hypothetical protein
VGAQTSPITVSIDAVNGFNSSVAITVEGLPQGITSTPPFPFSVAAGSSQQFTFSAPAAAGTFPLVILGSSGDLSNAAAFTLTATPQPNPFLVSSSYYPWYFP